MHRLFYRIILVSVVLLLVFTVFPLRSYEDKFNPEDNILPIMETATTEPTEVPESVEIEETTEPTTKPTELIEETPPTETESVEETKFVSYYSYTEEELDLLARLIYSEGCGESYDTKLKIASVVMNRVQDPYFPDTIYEVIYQESQFSVTVIRLNGVIMIDRPADEESYMAAKEVLDYGSVLPSTVQVFYAIYCTEPWVTSRVTYEVSDNTVFAHIYGG